MLSVRTKTTMQSRLDAILAESTSGCIPEEPRAPSIAPSLTFSDSTTDEPELDEPAQVEATRRRRASTRLIAQNAADIQRITGESTAQVVSRCCGGGCCFRNTARENGIKLEKPRLPDNGAFQSLLLKIDAIPSTLTNITDSPEQTAFLEPIRPPLHSSLPSPTDSAISLSTTADPVPAATTSVATGTTTAPPATTTPSDLDEAVEKLRTVSLTLDDTDTTIQPPKFVQPHPPYNVFAARMHNTRELTRPGAEKRTFHFDLDVTDYPDGEGIDFKVGGAIGVSAPNDPAVVDEILDLLLVPRFLRDRPVLLRTTGGRWPTVWGEDRARELVTTRRALLTWCSDVQSYPPTKPLLRAMADHTTAEVERNVLLFLCSAEGQGVFCDFRTGPHVSLVQLLHAFPNSKPPLGLVLSSLQPLMPRFYSLSNDPHDSWSSPSSSPSSEKEARRRRIVEIAVTVHIDSDWRSGTRTGIGSGFFQRQALRFMEARDRGDPEPEVYVPMFKGLMANPLAKQFMTDGPMLLIGAGVGIAPFRGFVQRRLKTANCANKVWVLQGIRDSLVDEIYSGEWGVHEDEVKRVVQSRRGEGRYVQEEVRNQADLVWYIINSVDGRVFVCGSSRGMGEGVEESLVEVAMEKGNLGRIEARKFWDLKREVGQYIAETW